MDAQILSSVQMLDNRTTALENRMRLPRIEEIPPSIGSVPTYTGGQTNLQWVPNFAPSGNEGEMLVYNGGSWTSLAPADDDWVLTMVSDYPTWALPPDPSDLPTPTSGNILIADGTDWVSTSASDGELLIGGASGWTPTPAGAANTLLRSNGSTLAYDVAIEKGTANGQIMVWDTAAGGVGGITYETLPGDPGIVIQDTDGDISHITGENGIPWYTATGQPQFASLPSTAGLLYYDGSGGFTIKTIPSTGGLLTGQGTYFGSEAYELDAGYFVEP